MDETPSAAIYPRVSSKKQEQRGYSIGEQDCRLMEAARAAGDLDPVRIVETGSASRYAKRRRPGFDRLMDLVRTKRVRRVYVMALDRLIRTVIDLQEFLELVESGVHLILVGSGKTYAGKISAAERRDLQRDAVDAEYEVERLRERIMTGHGGRLKRGLPLGSLPPGLRSVPVGKMKGIGLDPVQAPKVRALLTEYADGLHSIDTLAQRAAELGVVSRKGNPLSRTACSRLLQNPLLRGRMRTGEPGAFPAVIDDQLWYLVQSALASSRSKPVGARRGAFAMGQLIRCGHVQDGKECWSIVVVSRVKGRSRHYTYARCASWRKGCPASSAYVPEADLIAQAQEILCQMHIPPKLMRALREDALRMLEEEGDERAVERGDLDRRAQEVEERLVRATAAQLSGEPVDGPAARTLVRRWQAEREAINARRAELAGAGDALASHLTAVIELAAGVGQVFSDLAAEDPRTARGALRYFLDDDPTLVGGRLVARLREPFARWAVGTALPAAHDAGLRLIAGGLGSPSNVARLEPLRAAPDAGEPRESGSEGGLVVPTGRGGNRTGALVLIDAPHLPAWWSCRALELIRRAA